MESMSTYMCGCCRWFEWIPFFSAVALFAFLVSVRVLCGPGTVVGPLELLSSTKLKGTCLRPAA